MQGNVWNSKEVHYAPSLRYEDFFESWKDGVFTRGSKPISTAKGPTWRSANLLTRDIGSNMYAAEVDLEPGGGHDYHAHTCVEFAYVLAGEAQFVYRSSQDKDVLQVLKVGDVAYFPAGTPHSAWNTSDRPCRLLIIKEQPPFSFEELPTPSRLRDVRLFDAGRRPRPERRGGRKSLKSVHDRADR